jgi:hypothetical protein
MTPFDPAAVSLRPALRTWLWPCLAFVVTAAVVGPIAYSLMADAIARDLARVDVDGRGGALGVWAMITFFTAAIPFLITRRLVNGPSLPSRGWSLVHPAFTPITDGYRSAQAPTLGDLLGRLERLGYQVMATACTAHGRARGPADRAAPLAGIHVVLRDARWAGEVRLVLAPALDGERHLGRLEVRAEPSSPTEELALFVMRELDGLAPGLRASPVDSALSADPARVVTAGLGAAPRFGAAGTPDGSLA